jgi:long-subunit acyl-CoA synthetase (AMP-forming)
VEGATTDRPAALDAATLAEAFQITARDNADSVALRTKDDEFSVTWAEYAAKVERVAAGLAGMGLGRGDTIALMLTNRPEFHFFDAAAMHLGATPFSIYNTYAPEQIQHLVDDAGNRILVTEQAFLDRVLATGVEHVVSVDGGDDSLSIEDVEGRAEEGFDFEAAWRAIGPEDLLTLIYTSGTTGPPKGVQISHANMAAALRSYDKIIHFPRGGRIVSYLPMAHIAERNVSQYLPMACGFSVTCCPDPRQVIAYLPDVHPTWFFAVPRIWEKLKAGLEAMVAGEQDDARKQALQWALEVGHRKVRAEQAGEELPDKLREEYAKADELVLSKLRERLGLDELEACNVGAAPTPREVIEFFHALGIPLAELWGLSETTGAGTCNPPERIKIGTVGPPAPDCEVKLAEDGEVLMRGPVVMPGYRNQPEQTREAMDDEGWFHTGDVGEFDEDGYLKIVDRKKELIISAAGKNMSPANIEAKIKSASPLIGQAIAIGDGRPYNVALITLDPDAKPGYDSEEAMQEEVGRGVERANEQLARVEQIKKYKILSEEWQPGGDELTPTMKLKRKPIAEKYADEIEALYA